MYKIDILPAERGVIVQVGCKMFVYGDSKKEKAQLVKDLAAYILNPEETEKKYAKERNKTGVSGPFPTPPIDDVRWSPTPAADRQLRHNPLREQAEAGAAPAFAQQEVMKNG